HENADPAAPAIVVQPLGKRLGLAQMLEHLPAFTELAQHWSQFEANFEGLLQRGLALRQSLENTHRLLEPGPSVRERRSRGRLSSGLLKLMSRLPVRRAPAGVRGEPLALLPEPVGVQLFYGIHDARVDVAAALVEHPSVGDVVGEGVLEGVLQVREELRRVEKFSSLQIVEQTAKLVLSQPTNCM